MTHSLIIEGCWLTRRTLAGCRGRFFQYFFLLAFAACAALFACYISLAEKDAATEENRALLIAITAVRLPHRWR